MSWDGINRRKSMNSWEDCPQGVKHESEIAALKTCTEGLSKDIKDIKERLLGRPSWAVTIIIAFLSTLAFSALTFAFTTLSKVYYS